MAVRGLSRRTFLRAVAGAGAATLVSPVTGLAAGLQPSGGSRPLRAGVGVADLTPELGRTFFGYVRPDRPADGVAVRLFARAVVLDDGTTRMALLTVDLGASLDKAGVVDRIADLGYGMADVALAPTHTHAGPQEWTQWLMAQMATAVRRADADLGPAAAGWARGRLDGVSTNRSLAAHLANHGQDVEVHDGDVSMDPEGPDHPRDLDLRVLRIDRPSGEPLAAWGLFAVHPTNFPNTNTLYSADLSGLAVRRFEETFRSEPGTPGDDAGGRGVPVGILANGNEGDLISLYDSYNPHSCADLMALRVGRRLRELWEVAGADLGTRVPLGRRWTRIRFRGQEAEPGRPVGDRAVWGVSFLGGAENGPSPFYQGGTEGTRRPEELADPVHGRKVIAGPAPWRTDPELQMLRIGSTLLTAVPGEATTEAGRQINAAALAGAPDGVEDAAVLGLANDYTGYYTTPEEYDRQHYEGGHTVFGKWSSLVVIQGGRRLSEALAEDEPAPDPETDPLPEYPPPGDEGGGVGAGARSGRIQDQPPCEVARMEVVEFTWEGGPDGHDRPVGSPFLVLERQEPDGSWRAVDSDLGVAWQWTAEDGLHLARYEPARDWPLGTHRFRVTAARYELVTDPFEIVASGALLVRGVEGEPDGDRTHLIFGAQNPPPAPREHLLFRDTVPAGGTVTFRLGDETHEARWDAATETWTATVPGDVTDATVHLDDGALTDGVGNRSGNGASFTIGEVADLTWPPDMAVGGTDRDWHGHSPAEADAGRAGDCAPGAQQTDGRSEDTGADTGDTAADEGAPALPATGGGAVVGGALALGAAAMAKRAGAPSREDDP